jgi:hypothetical protein
MVRLVLALLSLLGVPAALLAQQTMKEWDAFHTSVTSYEVFPDVLMTAKFTADDEVCEMMFQKQVFTKDGIRLDTYMPESLVKIIVRPWLTRDLEETKSKVVLTGGVKTITYLYDYATIVVTERSKNPQSGPTVVVFKWTNRTCRNPKSESGPKEFRSPVNLLSGYRMTALPGFEDGPFGKIWKDGALTIDYGFDLYGQAETDSIPKDQDLWREEQTIGIYHFVCVYTRSQELVVTLNRPTLANFRAKIRNQQDLTEVLLTILSTDRFRGYPIDPSRVDRTLPKTTGVP